MFSVCLFTLKKSYWRRRQKISAALIFTLKNKKLPDKNVLVPIFVKNVWGTC